MAEILDQAACRGLFEMRAKAVGAEVELHDNQQTANERVLDLLRYYEVAEAAGSFAVWHNNGAVSAEEQAQLEAALPGLSFAVTRERAAHSKVGISQLELAIAATGSMVQDASAVEARLVSTLPTVHIALLAESAIQPDLASVVTRLTPERSSFIAFITGPSRTADIERVLTIGVHGPAKLHVLIIRDAEVL